MPKQPPATPHRQHNRHGEARKRQLLEAARTLIGQSGYEQTRVADICSAAGVTSGLFHWYFADKAGVFAELIRDMRDRMRAAQAEAVDPSADALTRLRQTIESGLRFWEGYESFFLAVHAERLDPACEHEIGEWLDERLNGIVAIIKDGQAAGIIRAGDPKLHTVAIMGVLSSFTLPLRSKRFTYRRHGATQFASDWVAHACASVESLAAVPRAQLST